ncbi:MAG: hypothetical protein ACREPA_09495 [Candidatus Dormibacteraceae bacterium]
MGVGAAFLVALVALGWYARASSAPSGPPAATAAHNIPCATTMYDRQLHYHTHLDIFYKGQRETVPADIGIRTTCFFWLHTHDTSGVIHIEAPNAQVHTQFTLGDFFSVWGEPLGTKQVASYPVGPGEHLLAYVNGKVYSGKPDSIVLRPHEDITLEIVPPMIPPPTFKWPAGL